MPPTPGLSFYGSTDNLSLTTPVPAPIDIEQANVRKSIERDRAMATTPLLPPLITNVPPSQPQSVQHSPLESPTVASLPSGGLDITPSVTSPPLYPSPVLSTKRSISSFRRLPGGSLSAPPTACASEMPSPIPALNLLEQADPWSDRLGHANYTIIPKPYNPDEASLEALRHLRADWDQARINYTKHLTRTGEHYGSTSNTYALTEAKWAETEREWRDAEDAVLDRVATLAACDESMAAQLRRQDDAPAVVHRVLDAEKFPHMGDEDIVGPMIRDAVMITSPAEKHTASKFWKSLVGKVSLRK